MDGRLLSGSVVMEVISLPFHRRPHEPEYVDAVKLPDLMIRVNVNVDTKLVYDTLKKFVFDENKIQGMGEPTVAWMEFMEGVIHPEDWTFLNSMNLSIGQLETVAGLVLRQLSGLGMEGAEEALA